MHHFLDLLLILQDVGLHSTDLVLLVSDLLLQLRQFGLQGLHCTVCDASRRQQWLVSVLWVLPVPLNSKKRVKCQTPKNGMTGTIHNWQA